jgi:hypothetical protein
MEDQTCVSNMGLNNLHFSSWGDYIKDEETGGTYDILEGIRMHTKLWALKLKRNVFRKSRYK